MKEGWKSSLRCWQLNFRDARTGALPGDDSRLGENDLQEGSDAHKLNGHVRQQPQLLMQKEKTSEGDRGRKMRLL